MLHSVNLNSTDEINGKEGNVQICFIERHTTSIVNGIEPSKYNEITSSNCHQQTIVHVPLVYIKQL